MELIGKTAGGATTPSKDSKSNRSKINESSRHSENCNPNTTSPISKSWNSPSVKSATKSQKSVTRKCNPTPNPVASPPIKKKFRERKFIVAKKNSKREKVNSSTTVVCKCDNKATDGKCLCVAYESLRASQEEFFNNRSSHGGENELKEGNEPEVPVPLDDCSETSRFDENNDQNQIEGAGGEMAISDSNIKRRRDKLMEVARENVPEPGSGRVMHLVKAFEKLLSFPKSNNPDEKDEQEIEDDKKETKWALPGLQPTGDSETQVSSSSFCPSDFFLTSESLGLDSRLSASVDSSQGSISSRTSAGGQRSRRNSAESSGTFARRLRKKNQQKSTSLKPFKLRTEQRGRSKEEEFVKKVQQMMEEEEKLRIPMAQGLPWTTDQPESLVKPPVKEITLPIDLVLHSDVRAVERAEMSLVKPPVKEITLPIDLVLHSDVRAVERAEFDNQMAEKTNLIEQYRLERERQQKLAEEEEIRRLRKELVPKAQPMPYFDRPFMPRRSNKLPTIPRDPKFHVPQHKKMKSCMSWSDFCIEQQQ